MNLLKNANYIERLHELILSKKTGNPKELSERLGISRANLYILIEELNTLNLPVTYSTKYETFYYERDLKPTLSFQEKFVEGKREFRKSLGGDLIPKH
jgi:hypothetical protein